MSSGIFVHSPHMLPNLPIAVFALHRLARLPLFFRNTLEMPEASLIESVIADKDRFNDPLILDLRVVQGCSLFVQDEFGALGFPDRITPPRLKVPAQFDGIGVPLPLGPRVDLEADEAGAWAGAQVRRVQVQAERFVIEGWMIAGSQVAPFSCLMCSSSSDSRGRSALCQGHL
jgi:hypothetical protein